MALKNIAHRGAPRLAPENTLAAFERALALGVDGVELDVHRSSDGHAMVMHDRLVDRTTNGKGPIDHQPARDLRALDAGAHFAPGFAGERIPFLAEVLDLMKGKGEVQVELKGLSPGLPEEVVRLIEERDMIDQAVVTSFVHTLVRAVRELNPRFQTGILLAPDARPRTDDVLWYEDIEGLAFAARAGTVLPHHSVATKGLFDHLSGQGLLPGAWTVDDPDEIRRMAAIGATRMTSNVPDLVNRLLGGATR